VGPKARQACSHCPCAAYALTCTPASLCTPSASTCTLAPPSQSQFLDVGSGCGVLTACGAYLVGRTGCSVGFDVRRACISMGRDAVRRLTASNAE